SYYTFVRYVLILPRAHPISCGMEIIDYRIRLAAKSHRRTPHKRGSVRSLRKNPYDISQKNGDNVVRKAKWQFSYSECVNFHDCHSFHSMATVVVERSPRFDAIKHCS